ncbi:hypothetical protein PGQ11_007828 [Apiospora arundinis]|uniref:FXSXX-COOH protein n=1 Tax=Apiospora arundinis TaxID=335852 RepID=A0ABR2IXB6_9PEZI
MTHSALVSSSAQATPKTNASTPPERRDVSFLALPASIERHVRSDLSVEDLMRTIEAYQDSPPVTSPLQ